MRLPFVPRQRVPTPAEKTSNPERPLGTVSENKYPDRAWYGSVQSFPPSGLEPGMDLTIPSFGVIFLNPPEEAKIDAQARNAEPEYDHILTGTFEITMPPGVERIQYETIKIGVESVSILNMGPERGVERDELFRREMVYDQERRIIERSLTVAFSLILPCSLPVEDYHRDSRVLTSLYAIVEGSDAEIDRIPFSAIPALNGHAETPFGPRTVGGHQCSSHSHGHFDSLTLKSPWANGQAAGIKYPDPVANPAFDRHTSMSASAEVQSNGGGDFVLKGRRVAERPLRLVHNPEPNGGVSILDEYITGSIRGIGSYNIRLYSEIWTLASILKSTMAFTDIPPETTIYSFRIFIQQTHTITSPRDGVVVEKSYKVPITEEGLQLGSLPRYPGPRMQALWRGKAAGGKDEEVFLAETKGRIPTDTYLRPTTFPTVQTPLKVKHELGVEVYFSTFGEDSAGKKLPRGGPGELKVLRIQKIVFVPSCWLMPDVLKLPQYDSGPEIPLGSRKEQSVDLWDACACVLTDEEIEETFRRFAPRVQDGSAQTRAETMRRKAEAEGRVWKAETYPVED